MSAEEFATRLAIATYYQPWYKPGGEEAAEVQECATRMLDAGLREVWAVVEESMQRADEHGCSSARHLALALKALDAKMGWKT